jgi:hypothetical protein
VTRMDSDESFAIVQKDIIAGLGGVFTADNEEDDDDDMNAVRVADRFRDEEVITNELVAAVPWVYRCRHTGDFNGLFPTGRSLEVKGVTFVDRREGQLLLHRYVDWEGVIAQLGLSVSWRVPVTEDEYKAGRERGASPES